MLELRRKLSMVQLDLSVAVLCFRSIWQATKMTHAEAPPVGQALAWILSKARPNKIHVQPVWTVTRPEARLCSFDFSLLLWIPPCARTCGACWGQRCESHRFLHVAVIEQMVQFLGQNDMVVPTFRIHCSKSGTAELTRYCVQFPLNPGLYSSSVSGSTT